MKILVVYDGNNTGIMAKAIANGAMSLKETLAILKSVDEVKTEELEEADAIILGSPTINSSIGMKMKALIKKIEGLQFKGKIGSAFGSYGWSGEAPGLLMDELRRFNMDLHYPIMRAKRQPSEFNLEECKKWGLAIAMEAAKRKNP